MVEVYYVDPRCSTLASRYHEANSFVAEDGQLFIYDEGKRVAVYASGSWAAAEVTEDDE